ncbi:hypothetical protein AWC18_05155 [Mycolicibacter nonchromogenicus]|uniref:Uncharacterized protein n=2 Tax=Mycolicibacter nonchromogenicus TaxID=1782 RepID=A0A1X1ZIF3_MYCNO|nr:hypothetical protein A5715_14460 [Mycolicibacter heraklionensis]ORW23129.1 hypothetical protein AWC18_05155 [Mycolicibacter nonchromogenicus]
MDEEDWRVGAMPESSGEDRERGPKDLGDTVDRLDEKVAREYGSEARARETPKRGNPDEPPD